VNDPAPEPLLEEPARVLSVSAGRAVVEARRRSACGRCAVRSGCGHGLLDSLASRHAVAFELSVPEALADGLRPGDLVVVGVAQDAVLGAALRVYGPPLAGLVAGTLAGGALLGSDGAAALGAALGLLAGSAAIRVLDRRAPLPAPRLLRRAAGGSDADAGAAVPLKIV
jgi:sigma-E factor negative regulatory protein RseC